MRKFFLFIVIAVFAFSTYAQEEILTNQTIVDMVGMGFSDQVIITKINESPNSFNTDIESLRLLKEKNVSESIIVAMLNAKKSEKTTQTIIENAKEGIFYISDSGEEVEILPTVFSGTKVVEGILRNTEIASLPYSQSRNIINNNKPVFYFYFNKSNQNTTFNAGVENWWFKIASSPNEFVLIKMDKKKNERKIQIGRTSVWGPPINPEVDGKKIVPFKINKISNTKYEVSLEKPLDYNCEYCFFYQGQMPKGGNNQSVFDFSIQK